ncbi:MAG: DNA polymerase Y family protein, partial [bacterium]
MPMTSQRFACLLVSDFPLAVMLRRDPTLLLEPVALAETERENAVILAANGKATRAGLRPGISAAQAHTLCPGLRILVREPEREAKQAAQLLELLQNVTPLVEPEVPGVFLLEASGTERLYGGEQQLAEKLIAAFKGQGYPVQVGIGGGRFVARVAAAVSGRQRYTCVPSAGARVFLAPLPITHLELDPETEQRLLQLGLRTLGQLAAFPANELQARFGEIGLLAAQRSRGFDADYFLPELLSEQLNAAEYFTTPLYRSTTVLTQTQLLLERLFEQLQAQSE